MCCVWMMRIKKSFLRRRKIQGVGAETSERSEQFLPSEGRVPTPPFIPLKLLPVLLPLVIFIGTGLYGIDFGRQHPDEPFLLRETLRSLQTENFLPNLYNYPSVSYWLTFTGLVPEVGNLLEGKNAADLMWLAGYDYTLRVRVVFLLVSALAVVWVYLTVYIWRKSLWEALAAACFIGFSWEAAYHARWIAPDAILMQFGALTIFLAVKAVLQPEKKRWFYLAAGAAGLATGTKYTGGLFLLPVCMAAIGTGGSQTRPYKNRLMILVGITCLFAVTYLLTTPGTLLDSEEFWKDVQYERRHYGEVGHHDQTVEPGIDHLSRNLIYLGRVALSYYDGIALIFILLMLVGMVVAARDNFYMTLLLLSFPVVYVLYMSSQRVMFVRNLLVVFPFMAILAARGLGFILEVSRFRGIKIIFAAGMAGLLAVNALWLYTAAESIAERKHRDVFEEFMAYAADHPDTLFSISDQIKGDIDKNKIPLPENMVVSQWEGDAEYGVFYAWEMRTILPSNRPDTLKRWFGPHEINVNYYPLWDSHYVIVLPMEVVQEFLVPHFAP